MAMSAFANSLSKRKATASDSPLADVHKSGVQPAASYRLGSLPSRSHALMFVDAQGLIISSFLPHVLSSDPSPGTITGEVSCVSGFVSSSELSVGQEVDHRSGEEVAVPARSAR